MTANQDFTVPKASRWQGVLSEERTQQLWRAVRHRLDEEETPRQRRPHLAAGLALALGVALALFFGASGPHFWDYPPERVAQGSAPGVAQGAVLRTEAAPMEMTLEEGSALAMSAGSTIKLSALSKERVELHLQRGSVTCDVSKNPARVFSVLAGDVEVRVVGTKFSVHHAISEHDEPVELSSVKVEVERGIVEIWRRGQGGQGRRLGRLTAGQSWASEERFVEPSPTPAANGDSAANNDSAASGQLTAARAQAGDSPEANPRIGADRSDPTDREGREPRPRDPTVKATSKERPPTPDPARQQFEEAAAARRRGNAARAATLYEQFLRRHPGDARAGLAAFELGRLQMDALGRPGPALASLKEALRLSPSASFREDVLARITRVYALTGQGSACTKARATYQKEFPGGVHRGELDTLCP